MIERQSSRRKQGQCRKLAKRPTKMQTQANHVIIAQASTTSGSSRPPKRSTPRQLCDTYKASSCQVNLNVIVALIASLLLLFIMKPGVSQAELGAVVAPATASANQLSDFQLTGQVGDTVQLPCLIGRRTFCGDIYFIAWYKYNSSSKSWSRIEHKTEEELDVKRSEPALDQVQVSSASERIRSVWPRALAGSRRWACPQLLANGLGSGKLAANLESNFDCGQLHISSLQLADEGQYKCEITFSDSLDFDKCPATTLSHLGVIARPNEPELLVNGRPWTGQLWPTQLQRDRSGSFKEGDQVRLECLSSGGKPAPRIEWLNVSVRPESVSPMVPTNLAQRLQVEPMRTHWQLKKPLLGADGSLLPVTSSSVSVSLSRFDLNSNFVCLLLAGGPAGSIANEQLMRSPTRLAGLLASLKLQQEQASEHTSSPVALMSRWLKLPVSVKPRSASIVVRDVLANNSRLELEQPSELVQSSANGESNSHYYSLEPNRLYAVQCIVDDSRPRSQVVWYNRTSAIGVQTLELNVTDYLVPGQEQLQHSQRLSSFVRYIEHANGSVSTVATLLITTNVWDNLEELFCQTSNEAFKFDELIQVAPIRSAKLYVKFAPLAWLDQPASPAKRLRVDQHGRFSLRCTVAANPSPSENTIVQIEWLKDGRKLANQSAISTSKSPGRLLIERANLLHMAAKSATSQNQLTLGSKLIGSSSLTVSQALASDSGAYSCHFRLVPAPLSAGQQPQPPAQVTSGQANQSIQVNVIEEESKGPIVRVRSSKGLLIYGLKSSAGANSKSRNQASSPTGLTTVVVEPQSRISLKCEIAWSQANELGLNKIAWYLNGAYLHSTGSSDIYNFSLAELARPLGGSFTCAHHMLSANQAANGNNFHGAAVRVMHSTNAIDLKSRVGPRLLNRRDLLAPFRSFSELELTSNPANRLRLTCLAQCEPICSIDWSIERQSSASLKMPDKSVSNGPKDLAQDETNAQDSTASLAGLAKSDSSFIRLTKLTDLEPNLFVRKLESLQYRHNDSTFSWISQAVAGAQIDSDPRVTAKQISLAAETSGSSPQTANVFSRLELTYAQLALLLANSEPTSADHGSSNEQQFQVRVKCHLNNLLGGRGQLPYVSPTNVHYSFGHLQLDSNVWFPEELESDTFTNDGSSMQLEQQQLNTGDEPFNLTIYQESDMSRRQSATLNDQLHINILLDKAPSEASISLANSAGELNHPNANHLVLSENQLIEISDPNRSQPPLLFCHVTGNPYPAPKFKWTFTDLNRSEHLLAVEGPQLNLRQFIEFRQRQLNADPMSAYGMEVVSSIVGNYSCTATNVHGSAKANIAFQIQGRPLCKLALAREYLGSDNELMAELRCMVYSNPPTLETIWFRRQLQVATNKSEDRYDSLADSLLLSDVSLPVVVLNKEQKFMLSDIAEQSSNFKCLARNSIGYSEACELSQADKQTLLNTFNTILTGNRAFPALAIQPFLDFKQSANLGNPISFVSNASMSLNPDLGLAMSKNQSPLSTIQTLFQSLQSGQLLWFLAIGCSLALASLILVVGSSIIRRRYGYLATRKWRSKSIKHTTSWRFNTNQTEPSVGPIGSPFQSSKICINYYGGSNGDSEHDMVHSCSQSSHYEDFATNHYHHHAQQQALQSTIRGNLASQQQQQQPIYLNGNPTLTRRPLKFAQPNSSQGEGSFGQLARAAARNPLSRQQASGTLQQFTAPSGLLNQVELSSTMRDSLMLTNQARSSMILGEVPLITGAKKSRIDLDQQQQQAQHSAPAPAAPIPQGLDEIKPQIRLNLDQQTFSSQLRNDQHIYDDVIYNQMIM